MTQTLKAITGVGDVNVSLASGEATVQYDERRTLPDKLTVAVKDAGYGVDGADTAQKSQCKGCCCG